MHDTHDVRKSKELHDKEMNLDEPADWEDSVDANQQILSSFGYGEPDRECTDFENDSLLVGDILNYRGMGCMCCDNLHNLKEDSPMLAGDVIYIKCVKGHRLILGVLKEDL